MPNNTSQRFWFKRKYYGFGWYPATWEAWAILILYIILVSLNAFRIDAEGLTASDVMWSIFPATIIMTVVLIIVCYQTGESPIWQWGGKPIKFVHEKPHSSAKKSSVKSVKTSKKAKKKTR